MARPTGRKTKTGASRRAPAKRAEKMLNILGMRDDELRSLVSHATLKSFPRRRIVIREGDRTDSVYVIQSGSVKVFLAAEGGKQVDLNVLGPGEYFGEMVLESGARSASVMTQEPCKFFVIRQSDFQHFIARHPDFTFRLIRKLIYRTRGLLNGVGNLAFLDVYGRVARLLIGLAKKHESGRLVISGKLTKQDVANRVGASREMVSRVFKDLVAGGYIEVTADGIMIAPRLPEHW